MAQNTQSQLQLPREGEQMELTRQPAPMCQVEPGALHWAPHRWPRNRRWITESVNGKANLMLFPLIHLNYWDASKLRNLGPVLWDPTSLRSISFARNPLWDHMCQCQMSLPALWELGWHLPLTLKHLAPHHFPRLQNQSTPTNPRLPHRKGKQGALPVCPQRKTAYTRTLLLVAISPTSHSGHSFIYHHFIPN